MNKETPLICILGGMGPAAGVDLQKKIILNTSSIHTNGDKSHLSVIHLCFPNAISDRSDFLAGKTQKNPAIQVFDILSRYIPYSQPIIIGIACNTFHSDKIFSVFKKLVSENYEHFNIVSIIEACTNSLLNFKTAVLTTKGTYDNEVYLKLLNKRNISNNRLTNSEASNIHDLIYNKKYGIKFSRNTKPIVVSRLKTICRQQIDDGVRQIILGCTELSLVLKENEFKDCKLIDSNNELAKSIIKEFKIMKKTIGNKRGC